MYDGRMNVYTDYLKSIVAPLVNYPDEVRVEGKSDDRGVLLTLFVARDDMGIVIGQAGITAKAFREILRVFGARNKARISLKIDDPQDTVGNGVQQ